MTTGRPVYGITTRSSLDEIRAELAELAAEQGIADCAVWPDPVEQGLVWFATAEETLAVYLIFRFADRLPVRRAEILRRGAFRGSRRR